MTSTSQLISQEGYKQVNFVCRMCETESTSTYIFTEPIVCVECGNRIKNLEQPTDGIIINNKTHYVCKICIKFFSSVRNLCAHLKTIHGPSKLHTCTKCGKSYMYKQNLQKHIENHKRKWYQCPKCPRRFTTVILLQKHNKFHLKLSMHVCNTCGQAFASAFSLKLHSLVHLDYQKRKCQCKICFKYFSTKMSVQFHIKYTHSNDKPYKCVCGKTYKQKRNLRYHIETSKSKYPYSVCSKSFSSQSGLYIDGRFRSLLRPYECDTCKKTFYYKRNIRQHVVIHLSREKRYQCHICDKWFLNEQTLRNHRRVHSSLRPYECDTCRKTFKCKDYIRKHVILHLCCEKPYQCHECGKRFRTKRELNKHGMVHSSVRPYECDTCKKTFKMKYTLKRHVEIHLFRKTPYVCSVWDKDIRQNAL